MSVTSRERMKTARLEVDSGTDFDIFSHSARPGKHYHHVFN